MTIAAAYGYATICLAVSVFQICLIAGAPWGRITQGGTHSGALPPFNRLLAAFSIILLIGMAGSILSVTEDWLNWPAWMSWTALVIQAISTLLNWVTPSRPERILWGPITTTMLILASVVVVTGLS
ncbi:MAG: hypothetical protein AB8B84_03805 [Granulosicoccus sp.]